MGDRLPGAAFAGCPVVAIAIAGVAFAAAASIPWWRPAKISGVRIGVQGASRKTQHSGLLARASRAVETRRIPQRSAPMHRRSDRERNAASSAGTTPCAWQCLTSLAVIDYQYQSCQVVAGADGRNQCAQRAVG